MAVLFRTLDAYRIFDNVFIMTNGANNTESVSMLAYRQMVTRTAVGMGSPVSVLLFLTIVLIAVVLVTVLRTDLSRYEVIADAPARRRMEPGPPAGGGSSPG